MVIAAAIGDGFQPSGSTARLSPERPKTQAAIIWREVLDEFFRDRIKLEPIESAGTAAAFGSAHGRAAGRARRNNGLFGSLKRAVMGAKARKSSKEAKARAAIWTIPASAS
jgi:hypothetical protein